MKFEKFEAGLCPHFVKFGLKKIVSCELKETRRRAAFTRASFSHELVYLPSAGVCRKNEEFVCLFCM